MSDERDEAQEWFEIAAAKETLWPAEDQPMTDPKPEPTIDGRTRAQVETWLDTVGAGRRYAGPILDAAFECEEAKAELASLNAGKSPCGHWSAHAVTNDSGKTIRCLECDLAEAKRRAEELETRLRNAEMLQRYEERPSALIARLREKWPHAVVPDCNSRACIRCVIEELIGG